MISKTAQWYVCKIRYDKLDGDNTYKKVTEQFVIDALSFTEAEERIISEVSQYIHSDFEVRDITLAPYKEVWFSGEISDDRWYKAKLAYISIDEKTQKEKRSSLSYLVEAQTMRRAVHNIEMVMDSSMLNYLITSVVETQIIDVFEYKPKSDERGKDTAANADA